MEVEEGLPWGERARDTVSGLAKIKTMRLGWAAFIYRSNLESCLRIWAGRRGHLTDTDEHSGKITCLVVRKEQFWWPQGCLGQGGLQKQLSH